MRAPPLLEIRPKCFHPISFSDRIIPLQFKTLLSTPPSRRNTHWHASFSCRYQHMDAFRTDPSPPPASDRTTVADTTTVGAPRPTNNGTVSSPAGSDNRSKDRPVSSGTSAAASVSTAPAPSSSSSSTGGRTAHRNMQHVLPEIQFEKRRVETGLPQQHKVPRSSGGSGGGVDVADGVDDKSGGKRASCSGDKANKSETGGKELGAASGRSDG
ncbi:unnamed protein product, partial [Sphacelaria rigidula]